jgi:uncharacterized membrane protein YesL
MNFKPTLKKIILSIIIGLIIGYSFMCRCIVTNFSDWIKYELPVYIGFIFGSIFAYILFSLFEKKKEIESKKRGKNK